MAKLSVEITEGTKQVKVYVQGNGQKELLLCLGYLAHAVAGDMGISVPAMLGLVAAAYKVIGPTIVGHQKIDLATVHQVFKGGEKDAAQNR